MTTNEKFLDQCHAYLDGTLTAEETAEFLKQVDSDPDCELTFRKLSRAVGQLKKHAYVEPSIDLESRILNAVHNEPERRAPLRVINNPAWKIPLQAAAAIALVVAAGFLFTFKPVAPTTAQGMSDAQLEEALASTWDDAETALNNDDSETDIIEEMSI